MVKVGGDRLTPTSVAGLPNATFGLFSTQPPNYDAFTGFTTNTPLYHCTSDTDGDCILRVPIGAGGVPAGTQLWVAPTDGPPPGATDFWFANPAWQTAPLAGTNRQVTRHSFQTPALQSGSVYVSGSTNFIGPGSTTGETDTRRKGSSGVWPLSHNDPDLETPCGLNVALVVDMSSSMQQSGSVPALVHALNLFTSSLKGTPSQAALFTFSTDTPAVNVGPNTGLLPIAGTNDANAFRQRFSGWTNSTADGYTNWDRALDAVASVNSNNVPDDHFDLVVFLTDGLPTVYGPITGNNIPAGSGFTRFREMENAVASANLVKSSGGHVVNGDLQDGTRIVAVGVGAGLDAGSDNNLRSISGPIEYDGTNLDEADFFRTDNFDEVGERLRNLFLDACTPSVTVVKQIIPHGGTIANAYTPGLPWHFTAQTTTAGATVKPTAGNTDAVTGALNFDMDFEAQDAPAGISIHEDDRSADGYTLHQVDGDNAVCVNKMADDAPVAVTNEGSTGFHVNVGHDDAVSCTVYNEAPDIDAASITVHKRWRVTTDAGTRTYEEGAQPAGMESRLSLDGPEGAPTRDQAWGETRHGYRAGATVTIDEQNTLQLPSCKLTGQTIDGPTEHGRQFHAHRNFSTQVKLVTGSAFTTTNAFVITNDVDCTSHLTLIKDVEGGSASVTSWLLHGIGPSGALPGPSGTSGVRAAVTPDVTYQLAEEPVAGIAGLGNYRQDDERSTPLTHPASTGSWACTLNDGLETPVGDLLGQDGAIQVPTGEDVRCAATNRTAYLTLIKHVDGGTAAPADFTFTVTPVGANPAGAPVQTVAGAGGAGKTINVRPEQRYQITEAGTSGYSLAGMICTIDNVSRYETELTIPAGADATCTATNRLGGPGARPPLPHPQPGPPPTPNHPAPLDPATVTISKHADRAVVLAGENVLYTIDVRTISQAPAHALRICDRLPRPLVPVSAPGATDRDGQVCWTVATMPFGGHRTFHVTAHVPSLGQSVTVRNVARLTGANVRARSASAAKRLVARPTPPNFTG